MRDNGPRGPEERCCNRRLLAHDGLADDDRKIELVVLEQFLGDQGQHGP